MRLILWTVIACKILCSAAFAHDVGCDGKPPADQIKHSCCGDHDWLRLQPGQWRREGAVYSVLLDGQWEQVLSAGQPIQPLPSTDGCDYVWYRRQAGDGVWHGDESAHTGLGRLAFYCLQLSMAF